MGTTAKTAAPTAKQVAYIRSLFVTHTGDFFGDTADERIAAADRIIASDIATCRQASDLINWLRTYGKTR